MEFIQATLNNRVATLATYDRQKDMKDECHEATRERILTKIDCWLSAPLNDTPERCWWFTGQPGVGKSAIAITVAKSLNAGRSVASNHSTAGQLGPSNAKLYGQFFINHSFPETSSPHFIFPTIALQLASASSIAATFIHEALMRNQTLAHEFSDEQVRTLFIEPLSMIARHEAGVVVALFDGVDELSRGDDETLFKFTDIFSKALGSLPNNVKVLVFSRPEHPITTTLQGIPSVFGSEKDLMTEESRGDVKNLLEDKLSQIRQRYHLSHEWPRPMQVEQLCEHAAGHLGWATLAISWIGGEVRRMGNTAYTREGVFDFVQQVRKGNIYDLYEHVLCRVLDEAENQPSDAANNYTRCCQITLGCLVVLKEPQSVDTIDHLVRDSLEDFDVHHFFGRISSIITSGIEPVSTATTPQPHKSFFDWITSGSADERFRVDIKDNHSALALRCLRILRSSLHFNMANIETSGRLVYQINSRTHWSRQLESHVAAYVIYACTAMVYHLSQGNSITCQSVLQELDSFCRYFLLFWLEVTCVASQAPGYALRDELYAVGELLPVRIMVNIQRYLNRRANGAIGRQWFIEEFP
jgi:hypothetical protein